MRKGSSIFTSFRVLFIAASLTLLVLVAEYITTILDFRPIELGSLHSAIVSGATFVIGFLLSATIADYKESERIPSEFATNIEDMWADAKQIHASYPVFNKKGLQKQLIAIADGFTKDVRTKSYDSRADILKLGDYFLEMEKGGAPANFIVKLKQQQVALLRARHRVNYIQRIKFIPSATILARSIVLLVIATLVFTNVDGGMALVGLISFILLYMLVLISVISTPFHVSGRTRDDVSLFLISDAADFVRTNP